MYYNVYLAIGTTQVTPFIMVPQLYLILKKPPFDIGHSILINDTSLLKNLFVNNLCIVGMALLHLSD